ncbi:MAG TPA: MFS transporter, partial [Chloroflexota bacterium]
MGRARLAVLIVFLLHGLGTGMWIARIPAVQERLGLGVGALGLALLGAGIGTLVAMIPAGALVARHGSRAMVRWTALPAAGSLALLGAAGDGPTLFVALVVWGAGNSALDVAMNAQGSALERRLGRPIMSSLHGLWSLGNMTGAAIGAFLAAAGVGVQFHLLAAAPVLLAALLLAAGRLAAGDGGQGGAALVRPRGALLALAVVAFCAVTVEGAMFDWAGVYLRRVLDAPEATAASAASFFSAAMAAGRLGGDQLTARLPALSLARACALLAALGIAAIVLAPAPPLVFGGLVAVGLGLSVLVPLAFGAAGRSADMPAGAAIAAVATMSYFGFLVGPPTIGLVAERITLRGALSLLLALLAVIVLL